MYFDCANDTVVVTKPKVEYLPMAESGFKNIESWEEFADVAERYWHCRIYPNLHFPMLAPLLPVISVSDEGVLSLQNISYYMQRLNLESEFRASETFITRGPWSSRQLPAEWLDRIARYKGEHLSRDVTTPREGVDASTVSRMCARYRAGAESEERNRLGNAAGRVR